MQLVMDGLGLKTGKAKRAGKPTDELAAYRRAVRQHCLDCSGGSIKEAEQCKVNYCALWILRPGSTKEAR